MANAFSGRQRTGFWVLAAGVLVTACSRGSSDGADEEPGGGSRNSVAGTASAGQSTSGDGQGGSGAVSAGGRGGRAGSPAGGGAPQGGGNNGDVPRVTKTQAKKIYAHVMPWFDTPQSSGTGQWGIHWTMANKDPDQQDGAGRRQVASHYYPLIGPYASGDADVVEYQLLLMIYAGIGGVLIDWPGTLQRLDYPKNVKNSEAMIERTADFGLGFAVEPVRNRA